MRRPKGVKANKNERMIEIRLRFWPNDIARKGGYIEPKHVWSSGTVRIEPNATHGIKSHKPRLFNSVLDVGAVIERVLIANGIVLHPSNRMKKYIN
jgi:hypothetical protein